MGLALFIVGLVCSDACSNILSCEERLVALGYLETPDGKLLALIDKPPDFYAT